MELRGCLAQSKDRTIVALSPLFAVKTQADKKGFKSGGNRNTIQSEAAKQPTPAPISIEMPDIRRWGEVEERSSNFRGGGGLAATQQTTAPSTATRGAPLDPPLDVNEVDKYSLSISEGSGVPPNNKAISTEDSQSAIIEDSTEKFSLGDTLPNSTSRF